MKIAIIGLLAAAAIAVPAWFVWPNVVPGCDHFVLFKPHPDITAYELATIGVYANDLRSRICVLASNPIPAELARHFGAP